MVVATLRSDFLGEFQNHPVLQDSEYPHHFRYRAVPVDPMPLRSFPEIIRGPARLAGLQLDDGLVEAMVNDTGTRDALPLLAFTLRRLYERFGGDGRLTVDEYESLGRLEGAIREEAERIITEAKPAPDELEALHAAFVPTMVRINAEGAYARRRALVDDLPRRVLALLRRFVDARLLVTDRDSQGRETIEVAHEALLAHLAAARRLARGGPGQAAPAGKPATRRRGVGPGGRRDDLLVHRDGRLKDAEALAGESALYACPKRRSNGLTSTPAARHNRPARRPRRRSRSGGSGTPSGLRRNRPRRRRHKSEPRGFFVVLPSSLWACLRLLLSRQSWRDCNTLRRQPPTTGWAKYNSLLGIPVISGRAHSVAFS